jgi:fatty acid CoA ligase FadD9
VGARQPTSSAEPVRRAFSNVELVDQDAGADEDVRMARVSASDLEAVRAKNQTTIEYIAAACHRYAERTFFQVLGSGDDEGRTVTYAELWDRVASLATGWQRTGLVRPGDRVVICGAASPEWVVADWACLYLGAISVPVGPKVGADELAHILSETEATCLVATAAQLHAMSSVVEGCRSVRSLVAMDEPGACLLLEGQNAHPTLREIESVGSAEPRLPFAKVSPEAPITLVYTSGSTGRPKAVVMPERRWAARAREALDVVPQTPMITVVYLPLHHILGRMGILATLMLGGRSYLSADSDVSGIFEVFRRARPTFLTLIPRVSGLVYQHFQSELRRRLEAAETTTPSLEHPVAEAVMEEMRRTFLGGRIAELRTGTAPTAPEVSAFLARCFQVRVGDDYGSTEMGHVSSDGRLKAGVTYKLLDVSELGPVAGGAYPRGELAVKSPRLSLGYYRNPAANAALFEEDGFVRSGDIFEERSPGELVIVGRKGRVLKLAHGEFVNIPRAEDLFVASSPLIRQITIYANPARAYVLAVIVPHERLLAGRLAGEAKDDPARAEELVKKQLRREIQRVARESSLDPNAVPRDFLVEYEPFSTDNGLLTDAQKPRQAKIAEVYGPRLERLYAEVEARQPAALAVLSNPTATPLEKVVEAFALHLGLVAQDVDPSFGFAYLGGDSLSAVRVAATLEEALGVTVTVGTILDPRASAASIARKLEPIGRGPRTEGARFAGIHPGSWVEANDLRADRFLPPALLHAAKTLPMTDSPRVVLLTGASGFLGRFVLLHLLQTFASGRDGQVISLVRADNDQAARERLRSAFATCDDLLALFDSLATPSRLHVHASDLEESDLGLAPAVYEELAGRVDAIVHAAALVNHALSYRHLFEPNVVGTAGVMRLAVTSRRKAIHFVSTAGLGALRPGHALVETDAAADLCSRRPLDEASAPAYAAGYVTSKWAGEVLLRDLHDRCGIPITIHRCSMVLPHPVYAGQQNATDTFARLLHGLVRTQLAPSSFYDPAATVEPHYDGLPVNLVARFVGELALQPTTPEFTTYHVSNSNWSDGVSLDQIVSWAEESGYHFTRLPHPTWFARFRNALQQLPHDERRRSSLLLIHHWQTAILTQVRLDTSEFQKTLARLTGLTAIPPLDKAYVVHCLASICAGDPRTRAAPITGIRKRLRRPIITG